MKYLIEVTLNEKGKKLVGKEIYNITTNLDYKPDPKELESIVQNEVPKELIKNIGLIAGGLVDIKVGDYVKLTRIEKVNSSTTCTYVEIVKVKEIRESTILVENSRYPFDYNGQEHSRRTKNLSTIEIPTKEELNAHHYNIKRRTLINKIEDLIEDGALYNSNLKNEQLELILEIIEP